MPFEKCNKPGGVLAQIAEDQAKLKEQVDTTAADLYRKQEELRKTLMGGLYRGEYDPNLKYDIGETVSLNGTVYQSKIENNPDAPPSNNWRTINEVNVYIGDNNPPEQGAVEYGKTLINLTNGRTYTADGDGTVKYIGGAVDVNTVEELETLDGVHKIAILKDENRVGVFIYDVSKQLKNDGGTVFNGWVRHFSGDVELKWFGTNDTGIEKAANAAKLLQKNIIIENDIKYQGNSPDVRDVKFLCQDGARIWGNNIRMVLEEKEPNLFKLLPNKKNSKIAIIGDSKSHGRLHTYPWRDMWSGILKASIADLYRSNNYGFETIVENSIFYANGNPENSDGWSRVRDEDGSTSPTGIELRCNETNKPLVFKTHLKQNYFQVGFTGNGKAKITLNGNVIEDELSIATDNLNNYFITDKYIFDNGYPSGLKTIEIEVVEGTIGVYGVYFSDDNDSPLVLNYSQNGRRALYLNEDTLNNLLDEADVAIWALGENDDELTGDNLDTVLTKIENLKNKVKARNIPLIIIDFLEGYGYDHPVKQKYRELERTSSNIYLIDVKYYLQFQKNGEFDDTATANSILFNDDLTHYTQKQGSGWLSQLLMNKFGLKKVQRDMNLIDTFFDVGKRYNPALNLDLEDSYMYIEDYDREFSTVNIGIDMQNGFGVANRDGLYQLTATIVAGNGDDAYDTGELGFSFFDGNDDYKGTYKTTLIDPKSDDGYKTITLTLDAYIRKGHKYKVRIGKVKDVELVSAWFSMKFLK